jgi:hypothetical protein
MAAVALAERRAVAFRLQRPTQEAEVLVSVRQTLRVAAVLVIPVTIACALMAPHADGHPNARRAVVAVTLPNGPAPAADASEPDEQGALDLYGNDVSDAVAKYKLDADGSLYEAHSPQTQLPRLGSPKS